MNHSRFSFIRRNLGYKLLSLALALLLYSFVFVQRRPMLSRDVFVQPEVVGLTTDMLVKSLPTGTKVTVSGSPTAIEDFRNQRIKAVVNLAGAKPGTNVVDIKYRGEDAGVEVVGPQRTEVVVEKRERVTFTVDVLYNEKPPPGFEFAGPTVEPRSVRVSGLRSDVSRVAHVVAIVNNSDNSGAFSGELDVIAQSIGNEEVDSVTIEPNKVQVTLGLRKVPFTKEMVLSARILGTVAPGAAIMGYTFDPQTVTVTGSKNEITDRSSISVPADVSNIRESVTRRLRVSVPPGLKIVAPESEMVNLRIDVQTIATPLPVPTPQASPTPPPEKKSNSRENP